MHVQALFVPTCPQSQWVSRHAVHPGTRPREKVGTRGQVRTCRQAEMTVIANGEPVHVHKCGQPIISRTWSSWDSRVIFDGSEYQLVPKFRGSKFSGGH